jgi:hypothetical protein
MELQVMSDQETAVQAISEAQHILEEYLEPRHHDSERLLDRLVEVLERPSVLVAVDRLRRGIADNRPREGVDRRRSTPAPV